jgi:Tol biopolymer transport system component
MLPTRRAIALFPMVVGLLAVDGGSAERPVLQDIVAWEVSRVGRVRNVHIDGSYPVGVTDGGRRVLILGPTETAGGRTGMNAIAIDPESGRRSVRSRGSRGQRARECIAPAMSGDGGVVAFFTNDTHLLPPKAREGGTKLLVREGTRVELLAGSTELYGIDKDHLECAVSGDGRLVAYTAMVPTGSGSPTSYIVRIVLHDRLERTLSDITVGVEGESPNGSSFYPRISPGGRYISFTSRASNLVPEDTNGIEDAFVHDRETGVNHRVNVSSSGEPMTIAEAYWVPVAVSDTGVAAFQSAAPNLVDDDTNGEFDVFLHDLVTRETRRVSVTAEGGDLGGFSGGPSISGDGSIVVFSTDAPEWIGSQASPVTQVVACDLTTGGRRRLNVARRGSAGARDSWARPAHGLSRDGNWLVFTSESTNLPGGHERGAFYLVRIR